MRYTKSTIFSFGLTLLLCLNAQAHDFNWKAKRKPPRPEEISTFVSKVDGYAVKAFKGIVQMPYSVEQITKLLKNHQRLPEWIYQNRLVQENIIPGDKAFYMGFNGIWPASDRDVVMDYIYTTDPKSGGTRLRAWDKKGVYPLHPKRVRIPLIDNRWHIFPVREGWSEVHFETFVDLGGSVPKWIINIIANDAPRRTLKGMRRMLDSGDYGPRSTQSIKRRLQR